MRNRIELKAPVQTSDNPTQIVPFGEIGKHVANNGFLKGGLTNSYLTKNALSGYASFVADTGAVISRTALGNGFDQIRVGTTAVGQASTYGILARGKILADDAMPSADDTVIGVTYTVDSSSLVTVTVKEYNQSGTVANTKTFSFTTAYTVVNVQAFVLVRYKSPHYSDYQSVLISYIGNTSSSTVTELWTNSAGGAVNSPWPLARADSFVWAFESTNGWVSGIPGSNYSYVSSGGSTATTISPGGTAYCIPVIVASHSAILLTQNLSASSNLYGYIGYDSGGTFHSTMQWGALTGLTGTVPSSDVAHQVGFGYVEANITTTSTGAGNGTISIPSTGGAQATALTLTGMLGSGVISGFVNHYGRLTGTYLQASAFPFEIRAGLTNGIQTFLSAAQTLSTIVPIATWNNVLTTPFTNIVSFASNGSRILGCDTVANYAYSDDSGATWTTIIGLPNTTNNVLCAYSAGTWLFLSSNVTVGSPVICYHSNDAITWTVASTNVIAGGSSTANILSVAYGNGTWMAAGFNGSSASAVSTSSDGGVTWSSTSAPVGALNTLVFGNGTWVGGAGTAVYYSTDIGTTWHTSTTALGSNNAISIIFARNTTFVLSDSSGGIETSTDGVTFTSAATPFSSSTTLAYVNGTILGIQSSSSAVAKSAKTTLPISWTSLSTSTFSSGYVMSSIAVFGSSAIIGVYQNSPRLAQVALLASQVTISEDTLGTLLTNVGEIDNTYCPAISENSSKVLLVYRYNNEMRYVFIGDMSTGTPELPAIQKISKSVYKLNTISPGNLVDISSGTIEVGSIDYNGRMLLANSATTYLIAQMINAKYVSSMDVGGRTISAAASGTGALAVSAKNVVQGTLPDQYEVDYFLNGSSGFEYVQSTSNAGALYTDPNKTNPVINYIVSTLLPLGIGYRYGDRFVQDETSILLLDWFYVDPNGNQHESDTYIIGNEVTNFTDAFQLFGNLYVFDGSIIWLATITNNQYTGRVQIAVATGLEFLAEAPAAIYFLSSFDNSVWQFAGGQSLSQVAQFNQLDGISTGAYSVKENSIVLLTPTYIVFVRDGGLTQLITRAADQTSLSIYSTQIGIVFGNVSYSWQYTFNLGGTVVPLAWQSAYYGRTEMEKHTDLKFWFMLYDPTKSQQTITLTISWYNESTAGSQTATLTVLPVDWDVNGFARVRIQPKEQKALGTSIGFACATKITIIDCFANWEDDAEGIIPQHLSV